MAQGEGGGRKREEMGLGDERAGKKLVVPQLGGPPPPSLLKAIPLNPHCFRLNFFRRGLVWRKVSQEEEGGR